MLQVMSFLTDNAWPAGLLTIFEQCRAEREAFENRYYGPYDKLLNYCFGSDFTFYVAPQSPPNDDSRDAIEFVVFLVVFNSKKKPVLLVEVKDDSWAHRAELRYRADKQMHDRYDLMLEVCPTPRLWGLSVLGTSMRIYAGDTRSFDVTPPRSQRPRPQSRVLPANFLAGQWNLDILSQEGFDRVKEIVTDILTHTENV